MARMIEENGVKYWIDGEGIRVPVKHIAKEKQQADAFVNRLVWKAKRHHEAIKQFKGQVEKGLSGYLENLAQRNGLEQWEGATTIPNFDGSSQIVIKVAKRWTYGPELQLAQQKIAECILSWSAGANKKILALVNRAFKTDKNGQVDSDLIRQLKDLEIDDPLWVEAMDLIRQSEKLIFSKTYYYFQEADENGQLVTIPLDFSALQVEAAEAAST